MFTNEQLKQLIQGEVIGEIFPYNTTDEQSIFSYLKRIKAELEKSRKIVCEQEPLHFGSGYASYMRWFVYEKSTVIQTQLGNGVVQEDKEGLIVQISMLAPVVLIGTGNKSDNYLEGKWLSSGGTFLATPQELLIPPHLNELYEGLQRLFMKYNYTILHKEDVEKPLPFKANIATIFREPREYLIWDAIFYWED
ncbi:hypothetical protein R6U77_06390 [Lysinibacillus louembei]|uniref:Uncharacterized protein n=1 Tax=Lysinibacillus louembei TaxID=1470088 RepID=A0ABZ0RYI5_9BACI|nr:hypothetical protein [Lysinibacillus louembei]WPK13299.1 hypothetical protein R6U77_06390 [Lysinibacillus louembei]